jgi:catechol 2,3-dioxygenase-like lactoylglutathione lyase family enzyme
MTQPRTTTPETAASVPLRADHITLLVGSLDASMPYYDTLLPLLGYRKKRDHVWTDGCGFFFQFMQAEDGMPAYQRYGIGMNHLGFAAPDAATVHRVRDGMAEAGFPVPQIQHLGGATALFMKDPDGIRFEVTHYPPGVDAVD